LFFFFFDPVGVVLFWDDDPAWGRPSFFVSSGLPSFFVFKLGSSFFFSIYSWRGIALQPFFFKCLFVDDFGDFC